MGGTYHTHTYIYIAEVKQLTSLRDERKAKERSCLVRNRETERERQREMVGLSLMSWVDTIRDDWEANEIAFRVYFSA